MEEEQAERPKPERLAFDTDLDDRLLVEVYNPYDVCPNDVIQWRITDPNEQVPESVVECTSAREDDTENESL